MQTFEEGFEALRQRFRDLEQAKGVAFDHGQRAALDAIGSTFHLEPSKNGKHTYPSVISGLKARISDET